MKNSLFTRILKYIKPYSFGLLVAFVSAIINVGGTLLAPIIVGRAIDLFVDQTLFEISKLTPLVIALLITVLISATFGWVMNIILNKISYAIVKDLRVDAFKKVLKVPVSYLDSNSSGDILTRIINDTDQVSDGLLQGFSHVLSGVITIIVTIVMMLIIKWEIALVVIFLTPLSLFMASYIAKRNYKTFKAQGEIKGNIGGFLNEMISDQKVVLAYNHQEENVDNFHKMNLELYKVGVKAQFSSALINPSTRFVNAIVYAVVASIGAILIAREPNGVFTVGALTTFLTYASQYTKPFNEVSTVASELSSSFASLKRIFELVDTQEMEDEINKEILENVKGDVSFKNITFYYDENKPLIKGLDVEVKRGSKVAIVGPTGCGKTTLINLLMRYYDVLEGSIEIDGQDIRAFTKESLRENLGMVLQETWLFEGTVLDNIGYGKKEATREEIISAAKQAYADDFINKLPNGYDTIIDDESLSSGQKQLLCIARLMLRLPKILILDEATSNIDTRTEVMIQKAFNKMMIGRTSFIIAHRLSTIRTADKILVMKNGTIVEQGTHKELLSLNGFYKELYTSQFEK